MRDLAIRTGHLTPTLLMDELAKIDPPPERIYATHLKTQHYERVKKELGALRIRNLQVLRTGKKSTSEGYLDSSASPSYRIKPKSLSSTFKRFLVVFCN